MQMVKIFISGFMLFTVCLVLLTLGFVEEAKILILFQIVGAIGLLFFVTLLIFLFISFITRKPALIISEEGLNDKTPLYGLGFVKWDDIENMTIGNKHTVEFLSIYFHDPHLVKNNANPIKRLLLVLNERLTSTTTHIDVSRLNISEPELIEHINRYSNGKFNLENITETNVNEWKI